MTDEVSVVILSNFYISVTTPIARAVGAIYFGEAYERMPDVRAAKVPAATAAALTGTYRFGPDYYVPDALVRIASGRDGLQGQHVGLDYPPFGLISVIANRFLIRSFWVAADFTLGPEGKARELAIDGLRGVRQ